MAVTVANRGTAPAQVGPNLWTNRSMGLPRVVITGLGALACNGIGRAAHWDALRAGRSGIRTIRRFDASPLPCQISGELWDFDPEGFMRAKVVKTWHRHVHQGVACAKLAIADAELDLAGYDPESMAVAIGTSIGSPSEAYQEHHEALQSGGYKALSPYASSAFSGHAATVHVSVDLGMRGPALTISSGCATGLDTIAWGRDQIRTGRAEMALVGATESPVFYENFAMACSMGILSQRNEDPAKAMRPFDRYRDGLVLSEAACAVVLEREDRARARGARILGEIVGYASSAEGRNAMILDRKGEALARAVRGAMADAGIAPADVDAVQAHGVSIEMYDRCETNAYKIAFGEHAYRIPVSAVKSMVGQPYAAGGMLGVSGALLAMTDDVVAPTLNLEAPDPVCDLDYVPHRARRNDVEHALVTSMSFGGTHGVMALRRAAR